MPAVAKRIKELLITEGSGGVLFFVLFVYAAAMIAGIFIHEPWQDEAQAWLLANSVQHPGELLQYMKYEGTPILWHAVLWVIGIVGAPFYSIQILNALIMITAGALIVYATRLPLFAKVGILASYPFLFEYGMISRSYGLMLLLMVAVAVMHEKRLDHPLAYGVLLLALSQSTFFGLIVAAFFAAMHFEAALRNSSSMNLSWLVGPLQLLVTAGTVVLLLPNADVALHLTDWYFGFDAERAYVVLQLVTATFFPLPPYQVGFWNGIVFTLPVILLGVSAGLLSLSSVVRSRFAAGMYLFAGGSMFLFLFLKGLQRVRFFAAIFVLFVMAVILLFNESRTQGKITLPTRVFLMIAFVLCLQVIPAFTAIRFDAQYQFSPAAKIADYMEQHWKDGSRMLAYPQTAGLSTFAHARDGYRNPESFYALDMQEERTFAVWSQKYYDNGILEQSEIARRALDQLRMRSSEVNVDSPGPYFLISEEELTDARLLQRFRLVEHYEESIVDTERLYVYIAE